MELNRNHYFMAGIVVLLLGIQFRLVDSYLLNEKSTRFLNERTAAKPTGLASVKLIPSVGPTPRRVIRPPQWLGWAMISTGAVLILHSLSMKAPGSG